MALVGSEGRRPSTPNYLPDDNELIWSNYSDLTRPHPKWWFSKGNPLISGKSRLVKYYNLTRLMTLGGMRLVAVGCDLSWQVFCNGLSTSDRKINFDRLQSNLCRGDIGSMLKICLMRLSGKELPMSLTLDLLITRTESGSDESQVITTKKGHDH